MRILVTVLAALLLAGPTTALAAGPIKVGGKLHPVTIDCIRAAARYQHIPSAALLGVLAVERGRVGEARRNSNGSYDLGPMQINTVWLARLRKWHIPGRMVADNGCVNVFVGAWVLRSAMDDTRTVWQAIGRYHSRNPRLATEYERRVYRELKHWSDVKGLLEHINENVPDGAMPTGLTGGR